MWSWERVRWRRWITRREEIVERVEGIEQGDGGCWRDYPVRSCVFEILSSDVDANCPARPAEAVDEVGWHFLTGVEKMSPTDKLYFSYESGY